VVVRPPGWAFSELFGEGHDALQTWPVDQPTSVLGCALSHVLL
jgi:hypothetical protein